MAGRSGSDCVHWDFFCCASTRSDLGTCSGAENSSVSSIVADSKQLCRFAFLVLIIHSSLFLVQTTDTTSTRTIFSNRLLYWMHTISKVEPKKRSLFWFKRWRSYSATQMCAVRPTVFDEGKYAHNCALMTEYCILWTLNVLESIEIIVLNLVASSGIFQQFSTYKQRSRICFPTIFSILSSIASLSVVGFDLVRNK